jgi:SAM-dependent methyltransferase
MKTATYRENNRAKVSFDDTYTAPTPHRYLHQMAAVDYCMARQMHPFLCAAVDAVSEDARAATVLDVGCSYGMSSALLKTDHEFGDLVEFYEDRASESLKACVEETRHFLDEKRSARDHVKVIGMDCSRPAVEFAAAAQLLDGGIARNLEEPGATLTPNERTMVAGCDVLFSAGTIGYVSDRTVGTLLEAFLEDERSPLGPVAVMSVLQLFDPQIVAGAFEDRGLEFVQLPIQVAQRRFFDETEHARVVQTLQQRGVAHDPASDWMFADVCVAARPDHIDKLISITMEATQDAPTAATA